MLKKQLKVVLIGGPGTGKTTIINSLDEKGFSCFHEISRQVTLEAQKKGIDQLFLTEPILFSKLLLEGRETQFLEAQKLNATPIFFDRGLPDVFAYLNYAKTDYPDYFIEKSKKYKYDVIFHFSPWEKIHETDNERYESFEETIKIDKYLQEAYLKLGYKIVKVPFGSIEDRVNYILHSIEQLK